MTILLEILATFNDLPYFQYANHQVGIIDCKINPQRWNKVNSSLPCS